MITILNNCVRLVELGGELATWFGHSKMSPALKENFKKLETTYITLRNVTAGYLLEEVFLDLNKHFEDLFTARWFGSSLPADTICATLEDYFQDYNRLVKENFEYVIKEARNLVIKRYITMMLSKKMAFKTYEECQSAAAQITNECKHLQKVFRSVMTTTEEDDEDPLLILIIFAEILKCEDDMLSFDLHRIVEKYSDITEDQLLRLLYLRGDLSKSDLKEKVAYVLKETKPKSVHQSSILKEITFPKLVNLVF